MESPFGGDVLLQQQAVDLLDALVEPRAALVERAAEPLELVRQERAGEAAIEPSNLQSTELRTLPIGF